MGLESSFIDPKILREYGNRCRRFPYIHVEGAFLWALGRPLLYFALLAMIVCHIFILFNMNTCNINETDYASAYAYMTN